MEIEYDFTNIQGIGESIKDKLVNAGITSIEQLVALTPEQLSKFKGFGPATSKKIIERAKEVRKDNGIIANETNLKELTDKFQVSPIIEKISENKSEQVPFDQPSIIEEEEPSEGTFQELAKPPLKEFKSDSISSVAHKEDSIYECSSTKENKLNPPFNPQSDNTVKELEDFIENELKLQEQKEDYSSEAIFSYEEKDSETIHKELVSKKDLIQVKKTVIESFKYLGYSILDNQSNFLRNISKEIDILAYKILDINPSVGIFVSLPVKISQLEGNLLISEEHIKYKPSKAKLEMSQESLVSAQKAVFESITQEGSLFHLFRKKLANRDLTIRKTKEGTPLFISTHLKEYKPVVHPLLVSISEPAFLEKSILFPYQQKNNLHIVESKDIKALVKFLEKKISIGESFLQENAVAQYYQSLIKLKDNLQRFSIPVLIFGVIFVGIMFLQNIYLLATFTNLGVAVLIIYSIIIGFIYSTFAKTRKTLKINYKTPYYLKTVEVDEYDIQNIQDTMSPNELDQLLYEWYGKSCEFTCISEIENLKALKTQKDEDVFNFELKKESNSSFSHQNGKKESNLKDKTSSDLKDKSVRDQMISKYSTFLED